MGQRLDDKEGTVEYMQKKCDSERLSIDSIVKECSSEARSNVVACSIGAPDREDGEEAKSLSSRQMQQTLNNAAPLDQEFGTAIEDKKTAMQELNRKEGKTSEWREELNVFITQLKVIWSINISLVGLNDSC